MQNNNFKLLAIRPLFGCETRFLKNLSEGVIYKFYNEYKYSDSNENEITQGNSNLHKNVKSILQHSSKIPKDLYQINGTQNNKLNINVSALVGKNGSGKSSLLELLYAACYILAVKRETLFSENIQDKWIYNNGHINQKDIDQNNEFNSVSQDLYVQFFYQVGEKNICMTISDTIIDIDCISPTCNISTSFKKELLDNFFYTISINYSLYGLNSESMNDWIHSLFHKNDGYQTPIVITPYRNKGNIDVNSELYLSQTRLLTNLLKINSNHTINNKEIDTLVFTLDKIRINKYNEKLKEDLRSNVIGEDNYEKDDIVFEKFLIFEDLDHKSFFQKSYESLYDIKGTLEIDEVPNFNILCQYFFQKVIKISENYYSNIKKPSIKNRQFLFLMFFSFLSELKNDRSHVTLKLRQTLNIIRFNLLKPSLDNGYKWDDDIDKKSNTDKSQFKIKLNSLRQRLQNIDKEIIPIEDLIPMGCYSSTLWVKNGESKKSVNNLDILSSGEQHFIQSIQSILYHIINVNSVFKRTDPKVKYGYVNIILDEIELYFHPEFQRIFLDKLLRSISNLKISNIKGINIIFSTHSPFILSDIPKENTLKINNGKIIDHYDESNSLGANIHDLLDNDFYLKNGFMGEHTKKKTLSLIDFLNKVPTKNKEWNKIKAKAFINLIGEPLLKNTLQELYFSLYQNDIDSEIDRLKKIKKYLNGID